MRKFKIMDKVYAHAKMKANTNADEKATEEGAGGYASGVGAVPVNGMGITGAVPVIVGGANTRKGKRSDMFEEETEDKDKDKKDK